MPALTITVDEEGLALVSWDMPGRSVNVIDPATLDEFEAFAARLKTDAAIKAAIITSAKQDFCAGADLDRLGEWLENDAAQALRFSKIFRALETCGKPVVAAINGTCLGGGFELALACHYRVVAEGETIRLGLPEARIGLIPGGGGTQRLPRVIGAEQALRLMLQGRAMSPSEALALGAVDGISPKDQLLARARQWLAQAPRAIQPWDETPPRRAEGAPYKGRRGMTLWPVAIAMYTKETSDNFNAPRAILSAVHEGLLVSNMDAALKIEVRHFLTILRGPQLPAMARTLFIARRDLQHGARRPNAPAREVSTLGIIGAGFMGSGIAAIAAAAGMHVILMDQDESKANEGKARAGGSERISASNEMHALASCDLVIEAVYEDLKLKSELLTRAAAHMPEGAVLASNTSSLPITALARNLPRKADFLGIHFFSPVAKMQLVELIRGKETGEAALATGFDFARRLGKLPILVRDAPGFFTSRVVMAYVGEGHAMLAEGVPPALIENLARAAGMPAGPLALTDEVGLDVALAIRRAALAMGAAASPADEILQAMVSRGRKGRKSGGGYYDYPENGAKRLWPGLATIAAPSGHAPGHQAIKDRFLFVQALETARVMEEGIVEDVREADVGAIFSFGFPAFTGGPASMVRAMGLPAFASRCEALAEAFGPRFAPSQRMISAASE